MRIVLPLSIAAMALAVPSGAMAAPASLEGRWKTADGTSIVEFYKCKSGICGKIERFLVAELDGGASDRKNPDRTKRSRKLKGLTIFWNLAPEGDHWDGEGYTPKEGRYFNADLTRRGNRLEVKGCVSIVCRSETWTRVP